MSIQFVLEKLLNGQNSLKRIWSIAWTDRRVRCSLFAFLLPNSTIALVETQFNTGSISFALAYHMLLAILCLYAFPISRHRWKFTLQSFLLGLVNGWAVALMLIYGNTRIHTLIFCLYAYFFTLFHFGEFLVTALTNIESLRPDSFLLNHSPAYWTAAMCSWMEFWARAWIFPCMFVSNLKSVLWNYATSALCSLYISSIGIICCIVGELYRKLAMFHASVGFTHQIAVRKHRDHHLCTKGVYSLVRHPGYLGWMIWSVGTQLILCNPICVQAYAYISFRFFEDRIWDEERYLIEFFGQRYIAYQRHVPSGIPWIRGYNYARN